jgi:uncharacterized protein (DUF433 family)
MILPDFLVRDEYDEIRIRGTRVSLCDILFDYNQGESAESIALQFPRIPLAMVHKVIAFYLENKVDSDRYLKQYADDMAEQRATGKHVNLSELRKRLIPQAASNAIN